MNRGTLSSTLVAAAALVALAFFLRVIPYLASGVPYHTDTYPQLANVGNLVASTPVPLVPSSGFDSYNIFWPAGTLFYGVSSVLLGSGPSALLPLLAPFVTSLMAVIFFALLRSLGLDQRASILATALFAVAGGSTMISTGATKEGFALPLMLLVLLLLNLWLKGGSKGALALSVLSFGVLLASHSLTSVVGLILAAFLTMAYMAGSESPRRRTLAAASVLVLFSALAYVYFYVYAVSNLPYSLQPSDVVSIFAYECLLTAPVWLSAAFRLNLTKWTSLWLGAIALGVTTLFASALYFHPLLDSPIASPYLLALVVPYLAVAFLAAFGLRHVEGSPRSPGVAFASLWALGILGVVGFSAFATPGGIGTTMRILDFVYPGAAVLGAFALTAVMRSGRLPAAAGVVAVGFLLFGSAYIVPYSAFWSGPIGGSQRVYARADVSAAQWAGRAPPNLTVYGDARFAYLASYYSGRRVNEEGGFLYLAGVTSLGKGCLFVSSLIGQIGYIDGTYGIQVNDTAVAGLPQQTSLISPYSNGLDQSYCAR
jgi:hypothetical protein